MYDKGYDDINVKVTDSAIETRREFYRIYLKNEDKVPEGWNFNRETIYSDHPTLVKYFDKKKVVIRINVFGDNIKIQVLIKDVETSNIHGVKEVSYSDVRIAVDCVIDKFVLEYENKMT